MQSGQPSQSVAAPSSQNGASPDYLKELNKKNFVQRFNQPEKHIKNADGTTSTHKMASAEVDGKNIAFPTIVERNGKLEELDIDSAIDHALKTGEFAEFSKPEEAQWWAEGGYKKGTALDESSKAKDIERAVALLTAKAGRGDKTAEASLEFIKRKLQPPNPQEVVDIEKVDIEAPSETTSVQPFINPEEQKQRIEQVPEVIAAQYRAYGGKRAKEVEATGDITRQESRDVANLTALDYLDYRVAMDENRAVDRDKYQQIKAMPLEERDEQDEKFLRQIESEALQARFLAEQQELRDLQFKIEDTPEDQRGDLMGEYAKKKETLESLRATYDMVPDEYQKIKAEEEKNKEQQDYREQQLKLPIDTWGGFKARAGEAFDQTMGAIGSGAVSMLQVPKVIGDLFGEQTYGWSDKLYDEIQGVKEAREGVFGRPSNFEELPLSSRLANIGGNAVGSAILFAGGGSLGGSSKLAQRGATFGTAFLTSESGYYEEALASGMNPQEAATASTFLATVTAAIESAIPDVKYFEPSAFRASVRNSVGDALKSGLPVKEALKQGTKEAINALPEATKSYLKNAGKEGLEEAAGQLGEDLGKEAINLVGEQEYFNDTFDSKKYQEAVLGGFIAGGGLSVFSRPGRKSPTSELTLLEIAENEETVLNSLDPNNESDKNIVAQAAENLDALKTHTEWNNLSREDQAHALALSQEVKQIEEEQKTVGKVGLTDVAKEERVAELQGEINDIFSQPKPESAKDSFSIKEMPVYHGTARDIERPTIDRYKDVHGMGGMLGKAVYFTPSKSEADYFADLSLNKNPGGKKKIIEGKIDSDNIISVTDLVNQADDATIEKWLSENSGQVSISGITPSDVRNKAKTAPNEKGLTDSLGLFGDISRLAELNGNDGVYWGYKKGVPNEIAIVNDELFTPKEKASVEARSPNNKPLNQEPPSTEIDVANVEEITEPTNEAVTDGNIQPEPVGEQGNTEPLGTGAMGEEGRADTGVADDAQVQEGFEPEQGKKSLLSRAAEGTAPEDVKASIEKNGLNYEVESHEKAKKSAKTFIKEVGIERAIEAVRKSEVQDGAAAFIWSEAIDEIGNQIATETDPEVIKKLQDQEVELLDEFDRKARSGGRFISALGDIYKTSDFGYKLSVMKQRYKEANKGVLPEDVEKRLEDYDKQLKDVKQKLAEAEKREAERLDSETIVSIQEDVKRKAPVDRTNRVSLANRIRKAKLPDAFASDPVLARAAFNTAVELTATAVEAGEAIGKAIKKGLDNIRESDWYKSLNEDQKKNAEKAFSDSVKSNTPQVEEIDGRLRVPSAIIREKVSEGITDINELTSSIYEDIREDFPGITERDVRDSITGYGKEVSKTKDTLSGEINRIKRVGRLISQVEDLERRIVREKNPTKKAQLTNEEKELRAKIKSLSNELGLGDGKRLDYAKKRVEGKTKELQERIDKKDFSKRVTRPVVADTELIRLRAEQQRVRDAYEKELHKAELDNRTARVKAEDAAIEIWGLTRALMATGEMSFILIQGGLQSISHPKNAARAMYKALQHGWSEKKAERWGEFIKAQPFYETMRKSKLALSEYDARLEAREEQFLGGWINKIWDLAGVPLKLAGPKAYENWKKVNPFKAIERAGVGYLNTLRVLRFLDGMYVLEKDGKSFEENPQDYKNVADAINTMTGRATTGLETSKLAQKVLPLLFFSPKNWASQLKTSTPLALYHFGKMGYKDGSYKPSAAQKMALSDFMKFVTVTVGMTALVAQYLNNDDDDETSVSFDPTDTDFMKVKIGNTRTDVFGGRSQQIVYQARMILGAIKRSKDKKPVEMGTDKAHPTRAGLTWEMISNKLAPSAGLALDYFESHKNKKGERVDNFGKPYNFTDQLGERLYPMYINTLDELWTEQPETVAGFLTALSFIGASAQTYGEKKQAKEDNKK